MGRMEEYYLWKKGMLNKKISKEILDFFKTNPTDEQLVIINKYDKKIIFLLVCGLITYFVLGFLYGYTIGAY